MSPDQLSVELRPRNGWEAIDLGLQLARHCARPLFGAVAASVAITAALCLAAASLLGEEWYDWWWVVLWWLKPVYDRVAMHVLAHAVFGDTVTVRGALAALPHILRNSSLASALTWRRLSLYRSVTLAVDQLEGQRGTAARQRRRLICQRIGSHANGLIFCMVNFEWVLTFSLGGLIILLAPEGVSVWSWLRELLTGHGEAKSFGLTAAGLISYAAIICFVEPFYVAGGFGLYLKRRTDLEAWDIEIQFRRLANAPLLRGTLGLLLCAFVALQCLPRQAVAAPLAREEAVQRAEGEIAKVLDHPDFGKEEKRRFLRLRDQEEETSDFKLPEWLAWLKPFAKFWGQVALIVAESWRVVMWLILALLGVILLWWLVRHALGLKRTQRRPPPPSTLAGLNIRPESLPDDIAAAARALIAAERLRDALALLYRASLSRLAHCEHIPFRPGDTEGDCLRRVAATGSATHGYFRQLTRSWQALAYARRTLTRADAETLCDGWGRTFETPS